MELRDFNHLPEVTQPVIMSSDTHSAAYLFQILPSPALKHEQLKAIVWLNLPTPSTHTHTHMLFPQLIQRTSFLTCIFHFTVCTTPLPLTDTAQSRGASDIGSGNLSCDPELLTECLIFIATWSQVWRKVCSGLLQMSSGGKKASLWKTVWDA